MGIDAQGIPQRQSGDASPAGVAGVGEMEFRTTGAPAALAVQPFRELG